MKYLEERDVDVAIVQEPWLVKGKVIGLGLSGYHLYTPHAQGKIRTCVVAKKGLNIFPLTSYSNGDLTAVVCEQRHRPSLLLTSAYFPYDEEEPPPAAFRALTAYAKSRELFLIAGCDANGHHELWGSSDTNSRGESIFDFILSTSLTLCNKGNKPTFRNRVREEVIDITVVTDSNYFKVDNWRVSDTHFFSDHCRIHFTINLEVNSPRPYRNPKNADWSNFSKLVNQKLIRTNVKIGQANANINKVVGRITGILNKSFESACPLTRPKTKPQPVWWSAELRVLRTTSRKLCNKAKGSQQEEHGNFYKASFNMCKSRIKTVKRNSWQQFCGTIETINEASRLRRILSGESTTLGSIKKPDGLWTDSSQESLNILMMTHFPGYTDSIDCESQLNPVQAARTDVVNIISRDKVTWAINSFDPYKSSEPDGIIRAMMQHSAESVGPFQDA
ncbi:uncharacterized protein LOC119675770 [Teleopsis dalmanni]|uniref:uncharacterized protein LOC119675770 n=1 Tax=Teleopsis dalmanni TaxID=139649 RepID=UPI0018CE910A|nr:uncharacterized protein LOC119675770 [Teleopsis dalmanni]